MIGAAIDRGSATAKCLRVHRRDGLLLMLDATMIVALHVEVLSSEKHRSSTPSIQQRLLRPPSLHLPATLTEGVVIAQLLLDDTIREARSWESSVLLFLWARRAGGRGGSHCRLAIGAEDGRGNVGRCKTWPTDCTWMPRGCD